MTLYAAFFPVVSEMVLNIDTFQGVVSKLEIPVSWQHACNKLFIYLKALNHYRIAIHLIPSILNQLLTEKNN